MAGLFYLAEIERLLGKGEIQSSEWFFEGLG
jgi:hypothetical protein